MIKDSDVYKIGRLGKPHGVKGEISFQFDDDIFDRTDCDYLILCLDGIYVPFFIEEYRFKSDETALMKFCDVDTQQRASELTGTEVFFPRSFADDDEDNVSWAEIVGYSIIHNGKIVGHIVGVDDSTVNTLFELEDGTLIPASDDLITSVDKQKKEIIMELPDGLLD